MNDNTNIIDVAYNIITTDNKTEKKSRKGMSRRGNGEGSIFQRKDKLWCAQIQVEGTSKPKCFYGKQRKEVVAKLNDFKLLLNQNNNTTNDLKNNLTIDKDILTWLTTVRINDLKATSYDRLECTIRVHIIPNLGHYQRNELTTQQVQIQLINKMRENGLSYSSIKKAYDAINAYYKYYLQVNKLTYNPIAEVTLPATHKFEKTEMRFFDENEIKIFKKECISQYSNSTFIYPLGYAMIFILNTGIRLGEALALKWNNIDWDNKILKITANIVMAVDRNDPNNKNKRVQIFQDSTKTQSGVRNIPLNKTALNALEELKKIRYFGENRFILSTKENKPNKPRNFSRTFEAIIKKCEIEPCGIHTLRHTFASQLFKNGVDVKTVSVLLGHADVSITYNTYIHLINEQKAKAVELIEEI